MGVGSAEARVRGAYAKVAATGNRETAAGAHSGNRRDGRKAGILQSAEHALDP